MKKTLSIAVLLATALVGFNACSDDEENGGSDTTFTYSAPCTDWHCSIDDVRTFMKAKGGYTEGARPEQTSDGVEYYFRNKKEDVSYGYTIASDGLISCSVNYSQMNKHFDTLKKQVSTAHNITTWDEMPEMGGVQWWTTKLSGKKTNVAIGKSENYGGYMYVDFNYTEFDW